MKISWEGSIEKIDDYRWQIPVSHKKDMKVPGIIYADEEMLKDILRDKSPEQVANVACLPGIVGASLAMPDMHWGYGFPIGGVAAFEFERGIVSPGGVGYDINCGVRMLRSGLTLQDVSSRMDRLIASLFSAVPAGVGSAGRMSLSRDEEEEVMLKGARAVIEKGFGSSEDLEAIEDSGVLLWADPGKVSRRAKERGAGQLGTLGGGNHFLEVQYVEEIFDESLGQAFALREGEITVMIHCGSRGFGHQICDDYLRVMLGASGKYGIRLPDRQLACAPVESPEGKNYLGAMACAANYAFANRQCITHWVREVMEKVFRDCGEKSRLELIYDICHNIAKVENHPVNGTEKKLCVHRKGATRSLAAGNRLLSKKYRAVGQPVIIPGDMGRSSYLLAGTSQAERETFGSTCHGAGRRMSRQEATRKIDSAELEKELKRQGITLRAKSRRTLAEEAPQAYKDVDKVVNIVSRAGLSKKVARLRPIGVIKG